MGVDNVDRVEVKRPKPKFGYFEQQNPAALDRRYWRLSGNAVAVEGTIADEKSELFERGLDPEEIFRKTDEFKAEQTKKFVRSLATHALPIGTVLEREDALHGGLSHPLSREQDEFAASILLARKSLRDRRILNGVEVAVSHFPAFPETFTPFSNNLVRITMPHPDDPSKAVAVMSSLGRLASEIAKATQKTDVDAGTIRWQLIDEVGKGEFTKLEETEAEFLMRRASEIRRRVRRLKDIRTLVDKTEGGKILDQLDTIGYQLLTLWADRKLSGTMDREPELQAGFITSSVPGVDDRIEVGIVFPDTKDVTTVKVLPPLRGHSSASKAKAQAGLAAIGFDYDFYDRYVPKGENHHPEATTKLAAD